jgi:hypothetical protein
MSTTEGKSQIVKDKLILYLDGANPKSYISSATTVNNLAFPETGTLVNGVLFNNENKGYFTLDGTNDKIDFGTRISSLNLTFPFSVDLWINVNPTGNTTTTRGIFSTSNTPTTIAYYGVFIQLSNAYNGSGNYRLSLSVGNGVSPGTTGRLTLATSNEVLTGGTWCHVVGTIDSGPTFKIYVNGIERSGTLSGTGGGLNWGVNTTTEIGPSNAYNNILVGSVSNLKFYNKLLSQKEVLQNFNADKYRYNL